MKLAIMQPYFFPYIGYFQLMNAVDRFVVYDNIEFTRKGWINRNRILVNGADAFITLSLRKDSDFLQVKDRYLAESWTVDRVKMLNRVLESYRKAPNFEEAFSLVESCLKFEEENLFGFLFHSIEKIKAYLGIETQLVVSSTIECDHSLRSEEKVLEMCRTLKASTYINPIGGLDLYSKETFLTSGIELKFLKARFFSYPQFNHDFVPWLSVLDVFMFNSREKVQKEFLISYDLL